MKNKTFSDTDKTIVDDIVFLLKSTNLDERFLLYKKAAQIRDTQCGKRMVLRGLLEISSYCNNSCYYCGLNRKNQKAQRYKLSAQQILDCTDTIWQAGIKTVVMQSGEDAMPAQELASIIKEIKSRYDMAITLSVGERSQKDYECWKNAGADRYLLRIESSDPALYARLHADRTVQTRIRCLDNLQELGYQTGSGFMVGVPGQTLNHIAKDIIFIAGRNFDMVGIGPFIPHPQTPFKDAKTGDITLTMNAEAIIRLTNKNAWLPATTAVGSLEKDYRVDVLKAGANVIMPNFSPTNVRKKYAIYPGKKCIQESIENYKTEMNDIADKAGLFLDYSKADSLKEAYYKKI
ncbi:MAG: [FeFe] hydrogenase H-cluster radical SAM maturase HydE [Treponema sp. CETP13]|nr:MAG: [FeFe] hydrogenase H-cluster radical SAM maturase HydE [Treponema sp. CETP13]